LLLDAVKIWIENEFTHASSGASTSTLTTKEMMSYLQKLSLVDRNNFSPAALEEWNRKYLQLLYGICHDSNKYPLTVRQEVFHKVEKQFMLGLIAKGSETRRRFFSLYHDSLGRTLFIRLQFIIQSQDWENVSNVFWLTQGLDLLLAILVEDEQINFAPSSARVPPLMVSGPFPEHPAVHPQVSNAPESSEDTPATFDSLIGRHAQFLNEMSKLQVADLVIPLEGFGFC
jgi:transformation/transcription domain-associated protein